MIVAQYPAPLLDEGAASASVDPEPDRLLFVGRLDREKGIQILLEACSRLKVPYRLRILGAAEVDDNDKTVAAMLREDALVGCCEMRPPTSRHSELSAYYAAAAIVVVPSIWGDPSPLVRLEAMAHGRPVVAFASGGVSSAVEHGITGLLVPRADAQGLADGLQVLLSDPAKARSMGRAGRRYVESRLSARQHASDVLSAFDKIQGLREA
jgi:glycosyltransferase involved in cell wall biosynthesis